MGGVVVICIFTAFSVGAAAAALVWGLRQEARSNGAGRLRRRAS